MPKHIRAGTNGDELAAAATPLPNDHQSYDDAGTAELLRISIKTLQRLDRRKAGPQFFWVGSRKRRTLGAIRKFQRGEVAA
jgi:hypothetical protein